MKRLSWTMGVATRVMRCAGPVTFRTPHLHPCGSNMGTRSDGTPRIGRACP